MKIEADLYPQYEALFELEKNLDENLDGLLNEQGKQKIKKEVFNHIEEKSEI